MSADELASWRRSPERRWQCSSATRSGRKGIHQMALLHPVAPATIPTHRPTCDPLSTRNAHRMSTVAAAR